MMTVGGIVLCGGQSSRMGRPKVWLPFGDEFMLQRVTRILRGVVSPVVVVAAAGQDLPPLPSDVQIVHDELESAGPFAGLSIGLTALLGKVDAAYTTSCDVPLLKSDFVRAMIDQLEGWQIAIPREQTFYHPLAAVYRTELATTVEGLLDVGQRRMITLLQHARTREVDVEELRQIDPKLLSLKNTNTPEEYALILSEAGLAEKH